MNHFIDTHTHLFVQQFDEDRKTVVERAIQEGVNVMLLPNIDLESVNALKSTINEFANCKGMMGLHPCSIKADYQQTLQKIEKELNSGAYIAVGEIGLDYYWDISFKQEQKDAFSKQLDWALTRKLPVAIHTRDSFDDAIQIVESKQNGNLTGVFHCFGGTIEEGKRVIDAGFYLGIGGNSTFKKSSAPSVLSKLDLNKILLETDSPYLAPTPFRGKRNESSYLPIIAKKLASIYGLGLDEIANKTTENAKRLFNL